MALIVTHDNFLAEVIDAELPVVVDFFASWCPPCQRLAPAFDALAAELKTLKLVKVNVDESTDLAIEYGITSIPALVIFKQGKVIAKEFPHSFDKEGLRAQLSAFI